MRIVAGEDEIVRAWMGQKLGDVFREGLTLGVFSNEGRLVGGILFQGYTGAAVDLGAVGRVAFRRVFQAVGDMAFGHLGCVRVQCVTRASNRHVRRLLPRMKFKFEGTMRRHYGDEDGLLFSMLKHEAIALGYYREATHG